jgi:hypothetical protein
MARDPAARPQRAEEVERDLANLLTGGAATAQRIGHSGQGGHSGPSGQGEAATASKTVAVLPFRNAGLQDAAHAAVGHAQKAERGEVVRVALPGQHHRRWVEGREEPGQEPDPRPAEPRREDEHIEHDEVREDQHGQADREEVAALRDNSMRRVCSWLRCMVVVMREERGIGAFRGRWRALPVDRRSRRGIYLSGS